jgi:hypothetical protein
MTELELLGPRAHGEPCGSAVLKAVAEDFQVDEVLDIPLSGEGEHLWLWVEKRDLNTEEAARRLARAAGVPMKMISYAGLKDRQALTRQWFSLHLPGKADPDLAAEDGSLRVKRTRHSRKLQRGAHSANGFTLRLTGCAPTARRWSSACNVSPPRACPIISAASASAMPAATWWTPALPSATFFQGSATAFAPAVDGAQLPVQSRAGGARGRWQLEQGTGRRSVGLLRQPQLLPAAGGMCRPAPGRSGRASHRPAVGQGRFAGGRCRGGNRRRAAGG